MLLILLIRFAYPPTLREEEEADLPAVYLERNFLAEAEGNRLYLDAATAQRVLGYVYSNSKLERMFLISFFLISFF